MKTQYLYIAGALLLGASATSCRDENLITEGEGRMQLSATIVHDVKVKSRAEADNSEALKESALIWITDTQKGKHIYTYNGVANFPDGGLVLASGTYAAEVWAGDSVPASWQSDNTKRYRGYQEFEITRGAVVPVEVKCPIRNTVVAVSYGDKVAEVLKDYSLTISLNDGITDGSHSLKFEGETAERGYFMLNSRTEGFTWVLEGTELASGKPYRKEGTYKDPDINDAPFLAQTTLYTFNINYEYGEEIEIGGAYFDIEVVPAPVEGKEEEVLISLAPEIKGTDFDITQEQSGEPENMERHSIYITAASSLTSVVIEGDVLKHIDGYDKYDLLKMDDSHLATLNAGGLTINKVEREGVLTNLRINFEPELLNSLLEGDYAVAITATDEEKQTSEATFRFSISNNPVKTLPVDESTIDYTSVTLTSAIVKEATIYGFEIKKDPSARVYDNWTFVEGVVKDGIVTATVNDLEAGVKYLYRAVADDFASPVICDFTTPAYPQFPNAGFEEWSQPNKPWLLYNGSDMFWDSGNHGSTSVGASNNITTPDSNIKHSGNYSAKMESKYVVIKFAAGNLFAGKYLKTDGTDGILGWGRPWNVIPSAIKGYVKYSPVAIDQVANDAPSEYVKGQMDKGIIYCAIVTDEMQTYNGENYPVIIKTKKAERSLFDKNASNVLAYGEVIYSEATPGESMIEFSFDMVKTGNPGKPAYIIFTASASKGGDYYTGGTGSTMWLDDIEAVY